jgi:adenylylsulfate kinase
VLLDAISPRGSASTAAPPSAVWSIPEPGLTLWFTGLSGAGKTTLATALASELRNAGIPTVLLDADILRQGLTSGLGYSRADRTENVRRISELAVSVSRTGAFVLVAAIAPYRDIRLAARERIGNFLEVYVNAPIATCIARDPKGLYTRALAGELPHFTGISDPYEPPQSPDVECPTDVKSVAECVAMLLAALIAARPKMFSTLPSE